SVSGDRGSTTLRGGDGTPTAAIDPFRGSKQPGILIPVGHKLNAERQPTRAREGRNGDGRYMQQRPWAIEHGIAGRPANRSFARSARAKNCVDVREELGQQPSALLGKPLRGRVLFERALQPGGA